MSIITLKNDPASFFKNGFLGSNPVASTLHVQVFRSPETPVFIDCNGNLYDEQGNKLLDYSIEK